MADVRISYAADAQLTITLASLATSAGLTAGRESTAVDNTTNKYLDYRLTGKITTGTTPTTAKSIEVWVISPIEDTPAWPNTFTGVDGAVTVTNRDILASCGRLAAVIATVATSDQVYPFVCGSVAMLFGGVCPSRFSIFVVHDTAVALNATPANQQISVMGISETVV